MRVVVETYGTLRRLLPDGQRRVELEVEDDTTVRELLLKLGMDENEPWNASLNGTLAKPSDVVSEGSFLIVFPPIAGG
jgi:molybdopterin converting factor small subunit